MCVCVCVRLCAFDSLVMQHCLVRINLIPREIRLILTKLCCNTNAKAKLCRQLNAGCPEAPRQGSRNSTTPPLLLRKLLWVVDTSTTRPRPEGGLSGHLSATRPSPAARTQQTKPSRKLRHFSAGANGSKATDLNRHGVARNPIY